MVERAVTVPVEHIPVVDLEPRRKECSQIEAMIQREGDRLLAMNDEKGSLALLRMAAVLRQRRDNILAPF